MQSRRNNIPERDAFEESLISFAISRSIPFVGVCRGMQVINCFSAEDWSNYRDMQVSVIMSIIKKIKAHLNNL